MRARLYCPVGELRVDHTFEAEATLGRAPDNSISIAQAFLSGRHLRVSWVAEPGCYQLEDLGSSNGTWLDGAQVREPHRLGHLHLITLAERFHLVFQDLERCAARHGAPSPAGAGADPEHSAERTLMEMLPLPMPALRGSSPTLGASEAEPSERTMMERLPMMLPALLGRRPQADRNDETVMKSPLAPGAPPAARAKLAPTLDGRQRPEQPSARAAGQLLLEVEEESGTRRLPLPGGRHLLGRGPDASLQVACPEVSRNHAVLMVGPGGQVRLRDLGSSNYTFVDGQRIDEEVEVAPGQELTFGSLKARLVLM